RFVDEVAASGRVVGYTAYGEPRCMRPVVSASPSNPPGSDQTLSTARWFLGDRSERVELDSDDPASSNLNPEWEPTHWAVAIVLTYPDETWRTPSTQQAGRGGCQGRGGIVCDRAGRQAR